MPTGPATPNTQCTPVHAQKKRMIATTHIGVNLWKSALCTAVWQTDCNRRQRDAFERRTHVTGTTSSDAPSQHHRTCRVVFLCELHEMPQQPRADASVLETTVHIHGS